MKKLIIYFIAIVFLFSACDPIEKRDEMGAKISPENINATVESVTPGSNTLIVSNTTKGLSGTWFYPGGYSLNQYDTVKVPYGGDVTVTFSATTAGGIVDKNITVKVTDLEYVPGYFELTDNGAPKTWVYDEDNEDGYIYETADYDWEEIWGNPYEDENSPDFGAKMKFDLDGGFNYVLIEEDGTETKGSFALNMNKMTLQIIDSHIPDFDENIGEDIASTGLYEVKILEDDKLLMWQVGDGDGWAWVFKPESK